MNMELFSSPEAWISLLTLVALEIVLGIDNIVFITIVAGKLPPERQHSARRWGLGLALITRLIFLSLVSYMSKLTSYLACVVRPDPAGSWSLAFGGSCPAAPPPAGGHGAEVAAGAAVAVDPSLIFGISGRDLILLAGGLFLLVKATYEIYDKVEAAHPHAKSSSAGRPTASFFGVIVTIMLLDIVFSIDSVITAIGMAKHLEIMIAAVVIAMIVMIVFAGSVGDFVERHPSIKILALSFLVMIGILLIAEGLHHHFNKGFVYFGMAFSLCIELLNMRLRKRQQALEQAVSVLHDEPEPTGAA